MDVTITEPYVYGLKSLSQRYLPSDLGGDTGFGSKIPFLCPTMLNSQLTKSWIFHNLSMSWRLEWPAWWKEHARAWQGLAPHKRCIKNEAIIVRLGWETIARSSALT